MVLVPRRVRAFAPSLLAVALACRREAAPTPTPPEPVTLAPAVDTPSPARSPESVVATMNGEEIREAEVERRGALHFAAPVAREVLLLEILDERLLVREAAALRIEATEEELAAVVSGFASLNGLSVDALMAAVADGGVRWEDYEAALRGQILEHKLLRVRYTTHDDLRLDTGGGGNFNAQFLEHRARLAGCLRARAQIVVRDPAVKLPDNPYARDGSIAHVTFSGPTPIPADDLERVALAAAAGASLCDAIPAAIAAIERRLLEAGYLEARTLIAWPREPAPAMTIEVDAGAGPLYRVGEVRLDQSALPAGRRLKEADLRRRIGAHLKSGAPVSIPAVQAAEAAVTERATARHLEVYRTVSLRREAEVADFDLTLRLCDPSSKSGCGG